MSFPKARSSQKPQTIHIDKYEIRLYHDAGIVRFHRKKIMLGEVVPDKNPVFTLRLIDFKNYTASFEQFVDVLDAWRNHWKKNR